MSAPVIRVSVLVVAILLPVAIASTEVASRRSAMPAPAAKKRVLILCTGNSCRSQLAEALWRHEAGDRYEAFSAGVDPKGVNPLTLRVLKELSISTDGLRSKHLKEFAGQRFDFVITVCGHARDVCPAFPGAARQEHWPIDDPATAEGSEEEVLPVFRRARDAIRQRICEYLAQSEREL
jgi:arsenate reductase